MSPYIGGRHVSQSEWVARKPPAPAYLRDEDGVQHLANAAQIADWHDRHPEYPQEADTAGAPAGEVDPRPDPRARGDARAKAIASVTGGDPLLNARRATPVPVEEPKGFSQGTFLDEVDRDLAARAAEAERIAAIRDFNAPHPAEPPAEMPACPPETAALAPEAPKRPRKAPDALRNGHEAAATAWSEKKGLPKHNKDRPSQRPEARRERYIRNVATDKGISVAEARNIVKPRGQS